MTAVRHRAWPRFAAALLALPLLLPLAFLATGFGDGRPELWAHISQHLLPRATGNTLALAVMVGVLTLVPGIGFAWAGARFEYPCRRVLDWALVLPLAIPGYVVAFVYVGLFDFSGLLQTTWRQLAPGLPPLPTPRGLVGAALLLSLVLYPYVYLLARAAFLRQGSAALDAARSLGRGPVEGFFRVVLPMTRPAWVAGVTLAVLETLADFGAVSILGVETLTTTIFRVWYDLQSLPNAAQLACGLLGLVALALLVERLARGKAQYAERAIKPLPRRHLRGWHGWAVTLLATLTVTMGFLVPMLRLGTWAWGARGELPRVSEAAWNTVALGGMATLLVLVLALVLVVIARRMPGDRAVFAASFIGNLGYAVPGTVLAVGVMLMLVWMEGGLAQLGLGHVALSSSLVAVMLALSARFLRVGHGAVETAFCALRPSVIETARTLAVPAWMRFTRITLPLLRPGLVAGALLVLVEVMKELPATLMLRPFGWDTLAVRVYAYTSEGLWAQAAWPALLLSAVGLLPVWWLMRQQR
jgi:iron(III) transport system permease protein